MKLASFKCVHSGVECSYCTKMILTIRLNHQKYHRNCKSFHFYHNLFVIVCSLIWIINLNQCSATTGRFQSLFFGRIPPPTGQKYGQHDFVPDAIFTDNSNISQIVRYQSQQQKSSSNNGLPANHNVGSFRQNSYSASPYLRFQNVPSLLSYFFRPFVQPTRSPLTFKQDTRPSSLSLFRTTPAAAAPTRIVSSSSSLLSQNNYNKININIPVTTEADIRKQEVSVSQTNTNDQTFTSTVVTTLNFDANQIKNAKVGINLQNLNINDNRVSNNASTIQKSTVIPASTKNDGDDQIDFDTTTQISNTTLIRTPRQNEFMNQEMLTDGFTDDELSDLPPLPQVHEEDEDEYAEVDMLQREVINNVQQQMSTTTSTSTPRTTRTTTTVRTTTTRKTTPRTTTRITTMSTTPQATTTTRRPESSTVTLPPKRIVTQMSNVNTGSSVNLTSYDSEELRDLPPLADFPDYNPDYSDADQAIKFTPLTEAPDHFSGGHVTSSTTPPPTTRKSPTGTTTKKINSSPQINSSPVSQSKSDEFSDLPNFADTEDYDLQASAEPTSSTTARTTSSSQRPGARVEIDDHEFSDLPPLPVSQEVDELIDDGQDLPQFIRDKFKTTSKPQVSVTTSVPVTTTTRVKTTQNSLFILGGSSIEQTGSGREDYGDLAPVPISEEEYEESSGGTNVNVPNGPLATSTRAPIVQSTLRTSTTTVTTPKLVQNEVIEIDESQENGPPLPPGPEEDEEDFFNFQPVQQVTIPSVPTTTSRPTIRTTTTTTTRPTTTTTTTTTTIRPIIIQQSKLSEPSILPDSNIVYTPISTPAPRQKQQQQQRPTINTDSDIDEEDNDEGEGAGTTNNRNHHLAKELQNIRDSLQTLFATFGTPARPPTRGGSNKNGNGNVNGDPSTPVNHFFNIHIGTINLNSGDRSRHSIYSGPHDPHNVNPKRGAYFPDGRSTQSQNNDADSSSSQSRPVPSTSVMLSVSDGKRPNVGRPNANQPISPIRSSDNSDLPPMLYVDSSEFEDAFVPGSIKTVEGGPPIPIAPFDDGDDLSDFPPSHGITSSGNFDDFNVRVKPFSKTATSVTPFSSSKSSGQKGMPVQRVLSDQPPLPIFSEDDASDVFIGDRTSANNKNQQQRMRTGQRKIADGRRR